MAILGRGIRWHATGIKFAAFSGLVIGPGCDFDGAEGLKRDTGRVNLLWR